VPARGSPSRLRGRPRGLTAGGSAPALGMTAVQGRRTARHSPTLRGRTLRRSRTCATAPDVLSSYRAHFGKEGRALHKRSTTSSQKQATISEAQPPTLVVRSLGRTIRAPPPSACARSPGTEARDNEGHGWTAFATDGHGWSLMGTAPPLAPLRGGLQAARRRRVEESRSRNSRNHRRRAAVVGGDCLRSLEQTTPGSASSGSPGGPGSHRLGPQRRQERVTAGIRLRATGCEESKSRRVEESEQPESQAVRGGGRGRLPKIAGADYARVCVQWVARRTGLPQAGPSETSGTCHDGDRHTLACHVRTVRWCGASQSPLG
jgi:hypothetical protein